MLQSKFDPYTPTLKYLTIKQKKKSYLKHSLEMIAIVFLPLVYKTHLFKL